MAFTEINQHIQRDAWQLMPFALTLTHDTEDAKDLMQETICRALYNSEKFISGTNIKGWMYTIMRNIFINDYKKKTRKYDYAEYVARTNATDSDDRVIPQESSLVLKEIQSCVQILPDVFRFPLQMYFDGYKYREISRILDEPIGTIKSRIHLAKKNLQGMLEKYSS